MPRYFARISTEYASKNKLGKYLSKQVQKYHNLILEDKPQLNAYINSLKALVADANERNPRCKPDKLTTWNRSFDNASNGLDMIISLEVNQVWQIVITQEEESFLKKPVNPVSDQGLSFQLSNSMLRFSKYDAGIIEVIRDLPPVDKCTVVDLSLHEIQEVLEDETLAMNAAIHKTLMKTWVSHLDYESRCDREIVMEELGFASYPNTLRAAKRGKLTIKEIQAIIEYMGTEYVTFRNGESYDFKEEYALNYKAHHDQ